MEGKNVPGEQLTGDNTGNVKDISELPTQGLLLQYMISNILVFLDQFPY